jgi:beta-lactamase regulating signal transducer with metallopeptidase domain
MSHFAATAAVALIAAIWQGALLAAVVALTMRLLPALSAATRSLLWTATFALVVALHFLPLLHPANAVLTGPAPAIRLASVWSLGFVCVWFALSLYRAIQFLAGAFRLHQINRRAVPVAGETQAEAAPTGRGYTLCVSPDVDRPSVLGFFHPRILLPEGLLETLTPAELQQILLHETEHLRRSDDWTNLLQKLALVVFPLNPVLFWVERRLCLERELACDARVLSAGENLRKSYATTLTRLAEHSILRRGMNLALGLLGHRPRPSELSTRVHRILTRPAKTLTRMQTRLATGVVLAGALTLSTTLAHAPSLIAFNPEAAPEQATALGAQGIASETWAPKLVQAKAVVQPPAQPSYRMVETVAKVPARAVHHAKKPRAWQRNGSAPRVMNTRFRQPAYEQPRLTLTVAAGSQVQQFVVPTVAYVPAAYAALRTPEGWIIIQL